MYTVESRSCVRLSALFVIRHCHYTQPRASFYKSLNLLLTKSRKRFDDTVLLSLIRSFCLLVLLYGSDVWIVIPVRFLISVSPGTMFSGSCLMLVMQVLSMTCVTL